MNSPSKSPNGSRNTAAPDSIDEDAAHIDARSEDAPQQIEELIEHAGDLGRNASQRIDSEIGDSDEGEPEVLPG
ncbi:MAG: hypothetical protein JJD93_03555 [Ilumatobacteraceae bacterium]|nr:hypothetical protein [Ilumatobacteraceae bacterium]